MGFQNLQAFNLAMLAKQAWRILTSLDSLIARIYKAKYFPSSDILNAKISSTHPMHGIVSIVALRCSAKAQDGE